MKKTLKLLSNLIGFTGLWTALPIYFLEKQQILPVTGILYDSRSVCLDYIKQSMEHRL